MYNHIHSIICYFVLTEINEVPKFTRAKIKASKDAIFQYVLQFYILERWPIIFSPIGEGLSKCSV